MIGCHFFLLAQFSLSGKATFPSMLCNLFHGWHGSVDRSFVGILHYRLGIIGSLSGGLLLSFAQSYAQLTLEVNAQILLNAFFCTSFDVDEHFSITTFVLFIFAWKYRNAGRTNKGTRILLVPLLLPLLSHKDIEQRNCGPALDFLSFLQFLGGFGFIHGFFYVVSWF